MAEYFAGIGLVRMGLEPCGWQVVFANDFEPKKYAMYRAFFPDAPAHYVVGDIFDLDPACTPRSLLATCSFPCIDLSLAGNMGGIQGRHSSAFWGFIRMLQGQGEAAPPLVMVENVPGWLYSNAGADFRLTVQALNELGYACDVFTLDARRFTPQSRLRVFLVGLRDRTAGGLDLLLQRPSSLIPDSLRKSLWLNADLRWFYNDLPAPPPLRTEGLASIIEAMDESDPRWWSEAEVQRHLAMMDACHRERVDALVGGEAFGYRTFYRRRRETAQRAEVRDDDLAGCLRTAVGGSGKQFLIRAGRGAIRMRTMTPREYARLQGVPDHYPITVEGVQALTGFGDAVCAPAIAWIGRHALNPLAESLTRRVERAA
jgi:DNA (cytosine-5)-methyltransferase 1